MEKDSVDAEGSEEKIILTFNIGPSISS